MFVGRKIQANAEGDSEELVDPPKIEDKIGAVPHGLSTDSDVAKRFSIHLPYYLLEFQSVCLFVGLIPC